MAFKAQFVHGNPRMLDYTPSGADVAAGDVLVIGDTIQIAHLNIPDGELGALAAGGGVYDVDKDGAGAVAFTDGQTVYWDPATNRATPTAGALKKMGTAVGPAGTTATKVRVHHRPN